MSAGGGPPKPPEGFGPPEPLVLAPPVVPLVRPARRRHPDIVQGYLTSTATHIIAGPQNAGKTAFLCWMLAEILKTGQLFGHPAQIPPWFRLIVMDHEPEDWEFWCGVAGIEVPLGYWAIDDLNLSPEEIRSWKDKPQRAIAHFKKVVESMNPEPGGLLITDGALPIIGDGTTSYHISWANMIEMQRFTARSALQLTNLLICHAGKPKVRGSRDAKARDLDKVNLSAGALGAANSACYLGTRQELVGDGEEAPPYQRFSWTPHHAVAEEFLLSRTPNGLFVPYLPPSPTAEETVEAAIRERGPRKADLDRVPFLEAILQEQADAVMLCRSAVETLMARHELAEGVAYRVVAAAKVVGTVREEAGKMLKFLWGES